MLKNSLYPSNLSHRLQKNRFYYFFAALFWPTVFVAQLANYVNNGSFEIKYSCTPPYYINKAIHWSNIGSDTTIPSGALYAINCFSNAPYTDAGFQFPKSGETFARTTLYCINPCPYYASRGYPKNRLKANLIANKTYCVKMYVNLEDASPFAVSNLAFYFGDNSTDTIVYSNGPITYLTPQVKNPITNIVTDTLNWIAITGTFVATGNEKYLVIGNFESNASTTTSLIAADSTYKWSEYFIDDVSCIEVDLPAYAGPDRSVMPGDSVFIGREPDFAIDSGCIWYKLPNMATPVATISGLWVKPTITTTYVVKQVLECSPLKSDTVVVHMNLTGLVSSSGIENDLSLFPNPAQNSLQINCTSAEATEFTQLTIYNNLGQMVKQAEIIYKNKTEFITIGELKNGIYFVSIANTRNERVIKKLVISK